MKKYLNKVRRLIKKFNEIHFIQIPREKNMEADTLAKKASVSELTDVFDEIQYMSSIDLPEVQQIVGDENWMTPIVGYLNEGKLPQGRDEACKLRIKLAKYVLMDEVLYKRGFSFIFFLFPYLCRFLFLFFLFFFSLTRSKPRSTRARTPSTP